MKIPLRFARVTGTGFVALIAGLSLVGDAASQGKGTEKHPHIRKALLELREAKKQLQEAAHDYGGFRSEALRSTDVSIFLLEKALKFDGGVAKGKKLAALKGALASAPFQAGAGERHPHMRHALHRLREARRNLQEAAHDYGGFRSEAIQTIDVAIFLIEKGIMFDQK
jgi:hypothetical protein